MEIKIYLLITILSSIIDLIANKVTIVSPKALKDQFTWPIKASYSNFGKIPYGYTLTGRIYFDPDNFVQDFACSPITSINIDKKDKADLPPIVMVNRGSCNFVDKVKNVEDMGGHLALIINNNMDEEASNIIMTDVDRKGESLNIPGVLINFRDGQIIKEFYKANKNKPDVLKSILVEIEFEMEHASNKVEYSIFFSSEMFSVYETLKQLYHFHKHLRDSTTLKPFYVTNSYPTVKDKANCVSNGNFCINPRYDLNLTDGREIIYENIRQKCVYNYAYEKGSNHTDLYWMYMENFYDTCYDPYSVFNGTFSEECSKKVISDLGIDMQNIVKCVLDSFDAKTVEEFKTKNNKILTADRDEKNKHNIFLIPSILINNRTFWGSWKGDNIFEALCAAYKTKPNVCYEEGAFTKDESSEGGLSSGLVALIIISFIVFNVVLFFICRKYIKRQIASKVEDQDINNKINSVVTSYLALKETK